MKVTFSRISPIVVGALLAVALAAIVVATLGVLSLLV